MGKVNKCFSRSLRTEGAASAAVPSIAQLRRTTDPPVWPAKCAAAEEVEDARHKALLSFVQAGADFVPVLELLRVLRLAL
jgi:hypothetical protein